MKLFILKYCLVSLSVLLFTKLTAQTTHLLNKQGIYKFQHAITLQEANGHGTDNYNKKLSFTSKEVDEINLQLDALVKIFRQTPLLNTNKGFDEIVKYQTGNYNSKFGYSLSCFISIGFRDWLESNGKIWQPNEWFSAHIYVNDNYHFCGTGGLGNFYYQGTDWGEMFVPRRKTNIKQGIDLYGGSLIVIFNPELPPYWQQVTLGQYIHAFNEYWNKNNASQSNVNVDSIIKKTFTPDQLKLMDDKELQSFKNSLEKQALQFKNVNDKMNQQLKAEEMKYTQDQLNQYAYLDTTGRNVLLKVDVLPNAFSVMKPNPNYWDKSLPHSAIQFIYFDEGSLVSPEIPEKEIAKELKEHDASYFPWRLVNELNLNDLEDIILNNAKK
jgi:hypothetical protein